MIWGSKRFEDYQLPVMIISFLAQIVVFDGNMFDAMMCYVMGASLSQCPKPPLNLWYIGLAPGAYTKEYE